MNRTTHTVVLSLTLRRLLVDHQIWCSVDCCHEAAFQITADSIARWLDAERVDRAQELASEIESIGTDLHSVIGPIVLAVRGLESEWDAESIRAFWGRFAADYHLALAARQRGDG